MKGDSSDILGHRTLQTAHKSSSSTWPSSLFSFKAGLFIATCLIAYVLSLRVREFFLRWQERSYKLSMRRKHGIPDHDQRPFNVAYSDVLKLRREKETKPPRSVPQQPVPADTPPQQPIEIRHRDQPSENPGRSSSQLIGLPGAFSPSTGVAFTSGIASDNISHSSRALFSSQGQTDRQIRLNAHVTTNHEQQPGPSRRISRKYIDLSEDSDSRQHVFGREYPGGEDAAGERRANGDEYMEGDEEAEWQEYDVQSKQRGSKRMFGEEEEQDDGAQLKRPKEKRARKFSSEKVPQSYVDVGMDVDEEDENEDDVPELGAHFRGKKRDRAEAGSTFGGDDDDSGREQENDDAKSRSRRRKRRTVSKRKSDTGSIIRGKKRDRDSDDHPQDGGSSDEAVVKVSRKKRGKRTSLASYQGDEQVVGSDDSLDESQASVKSRARRIGDEWESNGVKYKIGPNGQRLRQALVKKARQKFIMPQDSQHPDKNTNLQVYLETWLTEEEYQDAKRQHLLAWQDTPERASLSVEISEPPSPQVVIGKNLLWKSATTTPAGSPSSSDGPSITPAPRQRIMRDSHRHSIATNVSTRINPFEQASLVSSKRVISSGRLSLPSGTPPVGLIDSTNGSPRAIHRSFSKWEKQDLEAKAMMKMREANKKKEAEREAQLKLEREKAEKLKAEKEKEERDKAEKDKKEKEKLPQITVAAPPAPSINQGSGQPSCTAFPQTGTTETSKHALFGPLPTASKLPTFPAPPAQAVNKDTPTIQSNPAPVSLNKPAEQGAKPSFSFPNAPPQTANNSTVPLSNAPPKPLFSFAPPPASDNTKSQTNASPLLLNRLGAPSQGAEPLKPGPDAAPKQGAGGQKQGAEPPKAIFSFAKAPTTTTVNAAPPTTNPMSSSVAVSDVSSSGVKFNFNPAGKAAGQPLSTQNATKNEQKAGTNTFGFKVPALPTGSGGETGKETSAPKFSFANPTASTPGFGAAKPATTASSANPFNTQSGNMPGQASNGAAAQPSNAPGKSIFGSATFGSNNQSSSNIFGSAGTSSGFGANKSSAEASTGNMFGSNSSTSGSNALNKPTAPAPNVFGNTSNAFGSQNAFGSSAATNPFGTSSGNLFGATSANQSTDSKTPTFSFSTPAAVKNPEPSKPTSTFGSSSALGSAFSSNQATSGFSTHNQTTTTPSTTGGSAPTFSFKFNESAGTNGSTTPQASPFGQKSGASGPSAFGFGAPAASQTTSNPTAPASTVSFTGFGVPPSATGQQQQ